MILSRLSLVQQTLLVHGTQAVALVGLGVWVASRVDEGGMVYLAGTGVLAILGLASATLVAHGCAKVLEQAAVALDQARDLDLGGRVDTTRTDEAGRIAVALGQAFDVLSRAFGEVRGAANNLATAASSVSEWAADTEAGCQQQSVTLDQTARAVGDAAAGVDANADQARQALQLALRSREVAEAGGAVIRDTVAAMGEIDQSSRQIAEIASTIDGIAFQTNLLALNAAVEAARAGESGRGFAVVATEVRALAQRSATAAREVKALIQQSAERAEKGTRLASRAGTTFDDVIVATRRVADIVTELSAGLVEQGSALKRASSTLDQAESRNTALAESGTQLVLHADALKTAVAGLATLAEAFSGVTTQPPTMIMPTAYSEDDDPELDAPRAAVPPPRRVSSDSVDFAGAKPAPPHDDAFEGS